MSKKHRSIELVVAGILRRDGKVLLGRKRDGALKGQYVIPGGHLEWGETMCQAVVREFKEETRLGVVPGELPCYVYELTGLNIHRIIFVYPVYDYTSDEPEKAFASDDLDYVTWADHPSLLRMFNSKLLAPSTVKLMDKQLLL